MNNVLLIGNLASEVELKIEVAEDRLLIRVSDNGCGLLTTIRDPGHDGLASMYQRLQRLGGVCHIQSQPGCGTTVELQLPLGAAERVGVDQPRIDTNKHE